MQLQRINLIVCTDSGDFVAVGNVVDGIYIVQDSREPLDSRV